MGIGPAGPFFGKNRFIEKPGVQDEGDRPLVKCRSDPRVAHHEVKVQVRDRVCFVEGCCGYRARRIRNRGKLVLSRNLGKKTSVGRHVLKNSSDPRVANPEVKVQVWNLVRVVGIVSPFAPRGFSIQGNSFYRAPEGRWAQVTCAGCPQ